MLRGITIYPLEALLVKAPNNALAHSLAERVDVKMSKLRTPRYYTGYREREDKMCASLKLLMLLNYSHGPGSRRYHGPLSAHILENTTHTFTVTSHVSRHILLCIMRGFACLFCAATASAAVQLGPGEKYSLLELIFSLHPTAPASAWSRQPSRLSSCRGLSNCEQSSRSDVGR